MENFNLNINKYGGKSIVPVFCDDKGTAFFINRKQLLTAAHVVSAAMSASKKEVFIKVEDGLYQVECKAEYLGDNYDVALLTCVDYVLPDYIKPFTLLSSKFHEGILLKVIGYPMEIGNGLDYFGVDVKTSGELKRKEDDAVLDFDTVVTRMDSFGFHSYEGFSGSPVINEFGYVVGIDTDQMNSSLGFVSLKKVEQELQALNDVEVICNDDLYDTSTYGLGRCKQHLEESLRKAGNRYDKNFHIPNSQVESSIKAFCNIDVEEDFNSLCEIVKMIITQKIEELYSLQETFKHNLIKKDVDDFLSEGKSADKLSLDFYHILWERDGQNMKVRGEWRKRINDLSISLSRFAEKKKYQESKFAYISAKAGCGKTHLLCTTCSEIVNQRHVYLLYGADFKRNEDPVTVICDYYGWDMDGLVQLSEKLEDGKFATFIIDALNEGEGTHFWETYIESLMSEFNKYDNLKLLVSIRNTNGTDSLISKFANWEAIPLSGHEDTLNAIEKSFDRYDIKLVPTEFVSLEEFNNPLFLSIFCKSYRMLTPQERMHPKRDVIYKRYLKVRNIDVSEIAEEDPKRDVTTRFLSALSKSSVNNYRCGDIPREQARKMANRICYYRTWRNSLLRAALHECLLMEYSVFDYGDRIGFEFDSMGDYMRSLCLLQSKRDEKDIVVYLAKNLSFFKSNWNHPDFDHYHNFLKIFLSQWNPQPEVWNMKEFRNGVLSAPLIESMEYRKMDSEVNSLPDDVVLSALYHIRNFAHPENVIVNFGIYAPSLMEKVHGYLKGLSINVRDLRWSAELNKKYARGLFEQHLREIDWYGKTYPWATILLYAWLLASSYQVIRKVIIRRLKSLFDVNPDLIVKSIDYFYDVNDPYVLEGLYCAIYGSILKQYDSDLTKTVAEELYKLYAIHENDWPRNLLIRQWVCSIFQFAEYLNPDYDVWSANKNAIHSKWNVEYLSVASSEVKKDTNYLGDGYGATKIEHSLLSESDFYRYTLHGNWTNASSVFHYKEDEDYPVILEDIAKSIEYIIKHEIGWTAELDQHDCTYGGSTGRFDQSRERIGKKYQWLGLYEILSYMCDNLYVLHEKSVGAKKEFIKGAHPWHTGYQSRMDSTLEDAYVLPNYFNERFVVEDKRLEVQDPVEWAKDTNEIPPVVLTLEDNDSNEWVVLNSFRSTKLKTDGFECSESVWVQGYFVKKDDAAIMKEFVLKHTESVSSYTSDNGGFYDFMWHEYPWHESYLCRGYDVSVEKEFSAPCPLYKSTLSQLQEEDEALDNVSSILYNAVMPFAPLMKEMLLHVSDRGVIKNNANEIVGLNLCKQGDDSRIGLIIRKDILDGFIQKGYCLFIMVRGYKDTIGANHVFAESDYEGFYYYNEETLATEPLIEMRPLVAPPKPEAICEVRPGGSVIANSRGMIEYIEELLRQEKSTTKK